MLRAVWSELPKLRRWSVLGGGAAIVLFTAYIPFFLVNQVSAGLRGPGTMVPASLPGLLPTDRGLPALLGLEGLAPVVVAIVLIFVSTNMASEWSQGTLRGLLVAEPSRLRLLAGKTLTVVVYVVVVDAVALGLAIVVALAYAPSHGIATAAWMSAPGIKNLLGFVADSLLAVAGLCLLATFVSVVTAVLTRSAAAAVGISLGYALAIEALLNAIAPDAGRWLPITAFQEVISPGPGMSRQAALAAAVLWMLAFAIGSLAVFRRADVLA